MVFAAASLREVFQSLASSFEKGHPDVLVRLAFAGSQELRFQIEQGARVDVFASADEKHMNALRRASLVQTPVVFAHNALVVIVPAHNPSNLAMFADLPRAVRLVVGAPEVPIGAYTEAMFAAAERCYGRVFRDQVTAHIRSRELNARHVLTKVALSEADAGIVYKTDALAAKDRVATIAIPADINITADYPIATLAAAPHPDLALAWVGQVLSEEGQDLLAGAGFQTAAAPPSSELEK